MSCYDYVNLNDCPYRLLDPTLESKVSFEMESAILLTEIHIANMLRVPLRHLGYIFH